MPIAERKDITDDVSVFEVPLAPVRPVHPTQAGPENGKPDPIGQVRSTTHSEEAQLLQRFRETFEKHGVTKSKSPEAPGKPGELIRPANESTNSEVSTPRRPRETTNPEGSTTLLKAGTALLEVASESAYLKPTRRPRVTVKLVSDTVAPTVSPSTNTMTTGEPATAGGANITDGPRILAAPATKPSVDAKASMPGPSPVKPVRDIATASPKTTAMNPTPTATPLHTIVPASRTFTTVAATPGRTTKSAIMPAAGGHSPAATISKSSMQPSTTELPTVFQDASNKLYFDRWSQPDQRAREGASNLGHICPAWRLC